jgi:hypothetical protein
MEDDGGIFNIDIVSSDEGAKVQKVPRDFQSEEDFNTVKKTWKPKVEGDNVRPPEYLTFSIIS